MIPLQCKFLLRTRCLIKVALVHEINARLAVNMVDRQLNIQSALVSNGDKPEVPNQTHAYIIVIIV